MIRSPGKTKIVVKVNATKTRVGCVVSIQPMLCSLAYSVLHNRFDGYRGLIYSYRREVRSCSFDCNRQLPGALNHRTGNGWASRSLFICLEIFFVFSMPEPHRTNTFSSFIIAESLNEIHMSNNCSSLSTVVLPNGATTIGESAFEGSTSLVSMVISEGITSIGYSAFEDCTSLVSVVIPRSVITMGGSVFYGCTSLASVTVPSSVSSIESYSFYGCTSLQSVTLLEVSHPLDIVRFMVVHP